MISLGLKFAGSVLVGGFLVGNAQAEYVEFHVLAVVWMPKSQVI